MKRCPHCRAQDNEDAIICKSCLRYFNAPVQPAVVAASTGKSGPTAAGPAKATSKPRPSSLLGIIRLLFFVAVIVYGVGWKTVTEWIWPPAETPVPMTAPATPTSRPAPAPASDATAAPAQPAAASASAGERSTEPKPESPPAPAREPVRPPAREPAAASSSRGAQTALR